MSEVVGVGCEIHITQMYQLTADGLVDGVFRGRWDSLCFCEEERVLRN